MEATLIITTKNRKESLRAAVSSALCQRDVQLEILVIDDGSTDGTTEMLVSTFPSVRVERRDVSKGPICRRNEAARLAKGPIIFSIDDDAEFLSPLTIFETLRYFKNPNYGTVAMPFRNINQNSFIHQQPSVYGRKRILYTFVGTAYAIRKDLFLKIGGYREILFAYLEESDFCVRLLDHGHFVITGKTEPINHYESPKRNNHNNTILSARNNILFGFFNVPLIILLPHLAFTTFRSLLSGFRSGHFRSSFEGIIRGYITAVLNFKLRQAVKWKTYWIFRSLKARELKRYKLYLHENFD